jgi:hypothetical protein
VFEPFALGGQGGFGRPALRLALALARVDPGVEKRHRTVEGLFHA